MAMPASTANWHWKNKDVTPWAKGWFERELTAIEVSNAEGSTAKIAQVTLVEGDVELGQRKSKLITIFDCKIVLKWSGATPDGTQVEGKLTIPEVSHEVTVDKLSDYIYDWSLDTASSPAVNAVLALAKSLIPAALEEKLSAFPAAIIDTHGKDLTVSAAPSTDVSRVGTPAPPLPSSGTAATTSHGPVPVKRDIKPINTSTVNVDANFMVAADELFGLLTDENRIPMWTRAPAQSKLEAGGEFSLFGGGVKGTYVSFDRPAKIVQTWALQSPTWPSGHLATLTTNIEQNSDSTKITLTLKGVPTGMEDEIKRNLEGYYIHGFKSIGYVHLIPSPPTHANGTGSRPREKAAKPPSDAPGYARPVAIMFAVMALAAAFILPLYSRSQ